MCLRHLHDYYRYNFSLLQETIEKIANHSIIFKWKITLWNSQKNYKNNTSTDLESSPTSKNMMGTGKQFEKNNQVRV